MSTSQPPEGTNRPDLPDRTQIPHPQPDPAQPDAASESVGPETWVREAIAEQEEHIKRWRSCMDTLGRSHTYRDVTHTPPPDDTSGLAVTYRACTVCGVTETRADYAIKQQALPRAHRQP